MKNNSTLRLTVAALLTAIGIIIPMYSPFKIVIPPAASFTLASHVPIFIAMYISPGVAATVAIGTTLGFFMGMFPLIIVLRAASHIVFATLGALYLQRAGKVHSSATVLIIFSFFIALTHAAGEVIVVTVFFFQGNLDAAYSIMLILLLFGLGTVIHSMTDFGIAHFIKSALKKSKTSELLFIRAKQK